MTLRQFYYDVWTSAKNNRWRIGQALFNELCNVRPDIAERLRTTPSDPFFSESPTDPRYENAIKVIELEWFSEDWIKE